MKNGCARKRGALFRTVCNEHSVLDIAGTSKSLSTSHSGPLFNLQAPPRIKLFLELSASEERQKHLGHFFGLCAGCSGASEWNGVWNRPYVIRQVPNPCHFLSGEGRSEAACDPDVWNEFWIARAHGLVPDRMCLDAAIYAYTI